MQRCSRYRPLPTLLLFHLTFVRYLSTLITSLQKDKELEMNTTAMKKIEIVNALSRVPGSSLDKIKAYIDTFVAEPNKSTQPESSLKGICKDKGFERITDLDAELRLGCGTERGKAAVGKFHPC
ncbi:MAG: hypothetical protein D3923_15070 [Candidatus Electrothrix sp. AR3]|nr:hypothetical protein [Candidatus Electrothrix sp. AR3]